MYYVQASPAFSPKPSKTLIVYLVKQLEQEDQQIDVIGPEEERMFHDDDWIIFNPNLFIHQTIFDFYESHAGPKKANRSLRTAATRLCHAGFDSVQRLQILFLSSPGVPIRPSGARLSQEEESAQESYD